MSTCCPVAVAGNSRLERANGPLEIVFSETEATPPAAFSRGALLDQSTAWVGLLKTNDGGSTWREVHPPNEARAFFFNGEQVFGLEPPERARTYFVSALREWLSVSSGVWQTDNGGKVWRRISEWQFDAIQFADSQFGWMQVWHKSLARKPLVTADGGKTWQGCGSEEESSGYVPIKAYFLTSGEGWAVGSKTQGRQTVNAVMHSIDRGCSWELLWESTFQPDETYSDIYFLNTKEGWLAGGYLGSLLRSQDGGRTWQKLSLPVKNLQVSSVYFSKSRDGWILAAQGSSNDTGIYHTRDGGENWEAVPTNHLGTTVLPQQWNSGRLTQFLRTRLAR
jgi:photosystem II stability/assembly factor-like uncharacterized protein